MEIKPKRSKFKIGCLGAIIIIILLIIIGMCSGGSGSTTANANTNSQSNNNNNNNSSSQATPTPQNHKIGESSTIGNYKITFSKIANSKTIIANGMTMDTTKNNYFIVNTTVENTSNTPIDSLALSNNIITLKANGSTYNVNTDACIDASNDNNNSYNNGFSWGGTINPNTPYSTPIIFSTPKAINHGELVINLNGNTATYKF